MSANGYHSLKAAPEVTEKGPSLSPSIPPLQESELIHSISKHAFTTRLGKTISSFSEFYYLFIYLTGQGHSTLCGGPSVLFFHHGDPGDLTWAVRPGGCHYLVDLCTDVSLTVITEDHTEFPDEGIAEQKAEKSSTEIL